MTTPTPTVRTVWELADMAGCKYPDSNNSLGALFLKNVQKSAEGLHEYDDLRLVPIHIHKRWVTFVELAAYREDVSEEGFTYRYERPDLLAGAALRMIADRLLNLLLAEGDEDE